MRALVTSYLHNRKRRGKDDKGKENILADKCTEAVTAAVKALLLDGFATA
jgi:hypothetical protein